jgi:hypothetical protein
LIPPTVANTWSVSTVTEVIGHAVGSGL